MLQLLLPGASPLRGGQFGLGDGHLVLEADELKYFGDVLAAGELEFQSLELLRQLVRAALELPRLVVGALLGPTAAATAQRRAYAKKDPCRSAKSP